MGISNRVVALCIGVFLASCSETPPTENPTPAASAGQEQAGPDRSLEGHMATNFKVALEAREALIDGKLDQARELARQIAGESYKDVLPEHWMAGVEKMQAAARDVAGAPNLKDASFSMARLAWSCGECHSRFQSDQGETDIHHGFSAKGPEDVSIRMARHQRAADGFWFGLTIPSNAEWRSGARALTEAPEGPAQMDGQPVDGKLDHDIEAIRDMGKRALALETPDERVQLYGELLAYCSGCHEG